MRTTVVRYRTLDRTRSTSDDSGPHQSRPPRRTASWRKVPR